MEEVFEGFGPDLVWRMSPVGKFLPGSQGQAADDRDGPSAGNSHLCSGEGHPFWGPLGRLNNDQPKGRSGKEGHSHPSSEEKFPRSFADAEGPLALFLSFSWWNFELLLPNLRSRSF